MMANTTITRIWLSPTITTLKRSLQQNAVKKCAYIAGLHLHENRVNLDFDFSYRPEGDVLQTGLIMPAAAASGSDKAEQFANAIEARERRRDSQVGRHLFLPLPHVLDHAGAWQCLERFAQHLAVEFRAGSFVALHGPGKGDARNQHGHIVMSKRSLTASGFGASIERLDNSRMAGEALTDLRLVWREIVNSAARDAGFGDRYYFEVESFAKLGIPLEPTLHNGPGGSERERVTPQSTRKGRLNAEVEQRNAAVAASLGTTVQALKNAPAIPGWPTPPATPAAPAPIMATIAQAPAVASPSPAIDVDELEAAKRRKAKKQAAWQAHLESVAQSKAAFAKTAAALGDFTVNDFGGVGAGRGRGIGD
jgi:hypothetical protein